MKIIIRLGRRKDLKKYTNLIQITSASAYVNKSLGLTKKFFSKKISNSKYSQNYLKSCLVNTKRQKTWLAFADNEIVGSITCTLLNKKEAELTGFYVSPKYQGRGIGKKLYQKAIDFAGKMDLILDTYAHNIKTISMYKKWGWKLDASRGKKGYFFRHWPGWPEGLKAKEIYLRLSAG